MKPRACPECEKGVMKEKIDVEPTMVKGQPGEVRITAYVCQECGYREEKGRKTTIME